MIWEGEPAAESVRRLEDMGVHSLVFEPCMNKPETGDFMSVMRANIKALGVAYQ
jgi:zinc transport system substrate-binding protein